MSLGVVPSFYPMNAMFLHFVFTTTTTCFQKMALVSVLLFFHNILYASLFLFLVAAQLFKALSYDGHFCLVTDNIVFIFGFQN